MSGVAWTNEKHGLVWGVNFGGLLMTANRQRISCRENIENESVKPKQLENSRLLRHRRFNLTTQEQNEAQQHSET